MGFGNPADSIDQKIGQKMAELKNRRKDKINQIKKTPGAGEPFGNDPYEIEDEKLSREEIDLLYAKAKDIKNEEQENPDYDISGMKIGGGKEPKADTIGRGNRIAVSEIIEGEIVEEEKNGSSEISKDVIDDLGGKRFEDKDEKAQERAERTKQLRTELEIARKEYAEMYFKKRKMWDRVKGFFGGKVKTEIASVAFTESGKRAEIISDQDISYLQAIYENKLFDYKSALVENIRDRGIQGGELNKEMAEAMKFFNLDESANLYDVKTEARIEANAKENSAWGKIKETGGKIVSWYIKQPAWKKLAFAGIILGGTAASSALGLGTAVAGAFTLANFGRRILTGAASAVGAEAVSEKIAEKLRDKKSRKEMEDQFKMFEKMSDEEKIGKLDSFLKEKLFKVNEKFEKRNLGSFLRKSGSILFGGMVGSGAFGKMISFASEKTGLGEFLKEHFANDSDLYKYSPPEKGGAGPVGGVVDGTDTNVDTDRPRGASPVGESNIENQNPDADGPQGTNVPEEELQKAAGGENAVLEVQKGSSLEGSIIQHLKGHPELIDKYNELSGGRKFNAGQIAHRMALEYAEKNSESFPQGPPSLVHEGTEIKINWDTMEIDDIQSEKELGYLPENEAGGRINPEETRTSIAEETQQPGLEQPEVLGKELSEMNISERERIMGDLQERLGENEKEISAIEDQPATKYNTDEPWKYDEDLDRLKGKSRDIWSDIVKENYVPDALREIRKDLCMGNINEWRQIKDLAVDNPSSFSGVSEEVKDKIGNFFFQSQKLIGDLARPKPGETTARWTERVTRLIINRKVL